MNANPSARPAVSVSSAVIALLGLWLVISPWTLGSPGPGIATSGIICGALILVCSVIRFTYRHTSAMSWINALLGAWVIGAAWIFGENGGNLHTWNYTIVGVVIACLETISLTASALRPRSDAVSTESIARRQG
jgi:hypothetical protein